ncbi:DNA polymerase thumb domain-containing protein [Streptomyces sp. NBC_01579]|uniref:DNA polymerase Y family protein n=1 Tax=Streptomyces sp. NBC_01579 TaxID=2975885 RepID=UPI003865D1C2
MTTSPRTVMRIYFHLHKPDEELYEQLLGLLEGITPHVQPHSADWSADVDLTGALRYWKRDAKGLAAVIRLRALALYGVQSSAGIGPSRMVAAMAGAVTPPGSTTVVGDSPYDIAAFLRPQRAAALPGVGPAAARSLSRYGIYSIGDLADTPLTTLQRLLGTAAGRQAHTRSHGQDDRSVVPQAAARSASAEHRFDVDELNPDQHHQAVLGLVDELGARMRSENSVCCAITLAVRYADRTHTTRTRTLTEPTAHSPALADTGLALLASLGLQRARVRAISVRAERLQPAETATHQLTLDPTDERTRNLEAAVDRARARYGYRAAGPASTYRRAN